MVEKLLAVVLISLTLSKVVCCVLHLTFVCLFTRKERLCIHCRLSLRLRWGHWLLLLDRSLLEVVEHVVVLLLSGFLLIELVLGLLLVFTHALERHTLGLEIILELITAVVEQRACSRLLL